MPERHLNQAWSKRIERWLQDEKALGAPEPGDETLAAGLTSSLRAAWSALPDDYAAARSAAMHQLASLDRMRGALQRVAERIDRDAALAARHEQFGAAWQRERGVELQALFASSPGDGLKAWQHDFCEALAAWRLDVCDWLVAIPAVPPDRTLVDRHARALRRLRKDADAETIAWLDSLTTREGPLADAADADTRCRLLVLKARLQAQDLVDTDAADATLELADVAAHGPVKGLVDAAWGELHRANRRHTDAQAAFEVAISGSPDLPDGFIGRGAVAGAEGRWEEADQWFDRAIACVLDEPDPLLGLTRLRVPAPGRLFLRFAKAVEKEDAAAAERAVELALAEAGESTAGAVRAAALEERAGRQLASGRKSEAAADLRAGAQELVNSKPADAAALYERANALAAGDEGEYWRWADALFLASYLPQPPHVDPGLIAKAAAVWKRGAETGLPAPPFGWAYLTRAVIAEREALIREEQREALLWEAVKWTECALLFHPSHAYAWSTLCRLHRALRNDECAYEASGRGVEQDADNLNTLEERVIILVNTNRFADARAAMARWRELGGSDSWMDAVEAFVLLHEPGDDAQAALRRALGLTTAISSQDQPMAWLIYVRASLFLRLDDPEASAREWDRLVERYPEAKVDDRQEIAFACMVRGRHDEAFRLVDQLRREQPSHRDVSERLAGTAHLMRGAPGDLDAAESHLRETIRLATRGLLANWLAGEALTVRALLSAGGAARAAQRELLERMMDEARAAMLARPAEDAPVVELRHQLERNAARFAAGSEHRFGALATLGRLLRAGERFDEALACYHELAFSAAPPWQQGIDLTVEAWLDHAEGGAPGQAASASRAIIDLLARYGRGSPRWSLRLQLNLAVADNADAAGRQEALAAAADLAAAGDEAAAAGRQLVEAAGRRLGAFDTIWRFDDDLARLESGKDEVRRSLVRAARQALAGLIADRLALGRLETRVASYALSVARLSLHLGLGLFERTASMDFAAAVWAPLRQRVLEATGVEIPDVAIGDSTALRELDESYVFSLDEVALVLGRVRTGERFAPRSPQALVELGLPRDALTAAPDPRDNSDGTWVAPGAWEAAAASGAALWRDEFAFMVEHVDATIRPLLGELFGIQDAHGWLLRADSGAAPDFVFQCRQISADPAELHRLTQLLRALIAEGVPILDRVTIVNCFRIGRHEGPDALLRRTRQALRAVLRGNAPPTTKVHLPESLEADLLPWHVMEKGRGFLAMPPEDVRDLLAEIRSLLHDGSAGKALVVDSGELRAAFQRIVVHEHPQLPVLAADELVDARATPSPSALAAGS